MAVLTDKDRIEEIVSRSIAEIYPSREALKEALLSGKRLTFYVGIDPTADFIHLAHSKNLLILERLNKLGRRTIVLIGDFTARIGDPSDRTAVRVQLSKDQVEKNMAGFKQQIARILDFDAPDNPIELKFNSQWLSALTFQDSVELASSFTAQQMLERDGFQKRLKAGKPLYVHEFLYPLMQGYDSVAMDVDGEIGGTDQTFNMLAGRVLMKRYKNKDKFVIATTLLVNPESGEMLMSKSAGTGISLDEPPKSMFIKVMQLPDGVIEQMFVDCTRLAMAEIESIKKELADGANARDIKLRLAHEIVSMYHGAKAADQARAEWIAEVSEKKQPTELPILEVKNNDLLAAIASIPSVGSNSAARRLIAQGAVRLNDDKLTLESLPSAIVKNDDILSVGKRYTYKLEK